MGSNRGGDVADVRLRGRRHKEPIRQHRKFRDAVVISIDRSHHYRSLSSPDTNTRT